jgi:hypothetical protein
MSEFEKRALVAQLMASGTSGPIAAYIMSGGMGSRQAPGPLDRFGGKLGYFMSSLFGKKENELRKRYRGKPPLPRVTGARVGGLLGHYIDPDKIGPQ